MGSPTGSPEETEDLKKAYLDTKGSIGEIMTHIPHSTIDDEPRFIVAITKLIKNGGLPKMKEWQDSIKDEKARLIRKKESQREADEAEALAQELGVWNEFYSDGKPRKRKGKDREEAENDSEGDETAALKAVILQRNERTAKAMTSFFDTLEVKYAGGGKSGRGGKRGHSESERDEESSTKRSRVEDIPDDEWATIQERLFGGKTQTASPPPGKSISAKKKKGSKASAK